MSLLEGRVPLIALLLYGCVPSDPPGSTRASPDAVLAPAVTMQRWRPHATPAKVILPSNAGGRTEQPEVAGQGDARLTSRYEDDFERASLGDEWTTTSNDWHIEDGQLCGQGNRNRPLWLKRRIPTNVRITFDATAKSTNGDIKVEVWGDGRGFARGNSYNDATSYVFVFGGWRNQLHVLARLDEHSPTRLELRLDPASEDLKLRPVLPNVTYRFAIERRDGRAIRWSVNDIELFVFDDPTPLSGPRHDHFGFNNWDSPVCFDDLTITPLPE